MKKVFLAFAGAVAVIGASSSQATVITFNTDAPVSSFTGTYLQDVYSVKYVSGSLSLGSPGSFGNALYSSSITGGTFDLSRTDGGLLSLGSFLAGFGTKGSTVVYNVSGYLDGSKTYSETLTSTNTGIGLLELNPAPLNNMFDRISFSMSGSTTATGTIARSVRPTIDSINVNAISAVPEPATWLMMLVGFGLIGAAARYRRKGVQVRYA